MKNLSINHKFNNIDQVERLNEFTGRHFFSEGALKFFSGKIYPTIFRGRFFVTSEKPPHGSRSYTVRMAQVDGGVETILDHCGFSSKKSAEKFIEKNLTFDHAKIIELLSRSYNTGKYYKLLARLKNSKPSQWADIKDLNLVSDWLINWVEKKIEGVN